MIELIKNVLLDNKNINGWKIVETITEASELFFIKKNIDMNRVKKVHHFSVTVYRDFEENDMKFRGTSTARIHPTMTVEEIKKVIEDSAFASKFVKNQYYPLVKTTSSKTVDVKSKFKDAPVSHWMTELTKALYSEDKYEKGWINSSEFFLNKVYTRIINSEGVDAAFNNYNGYIELITNWKEDGEEVELYRKIKFSDLDKEMLADEVKNLLQMSREKAIASATPNLNKGTVLLTGEPVQVLLSYYYNQSSAQGVYNKVSTAKLNENIQGDDVKGDLINIKLDPQIEGSTDSVPYDEDGYPLNTVDIFKDGVLLKYWGDVRHSHYINSEPTGNIKNVSVSGGSKSAEEFRKSPYLELVAFSDFQMNSITGDFGGEIRLGWYFDGSKKIAVTGGSISGNIKEIQQEMYLSRELQKFNNFVGPKTIQLFNVSIAG
jgi:PmbA protein